MSFLLGGLALGCGGDSVAPGTATIDITTTTTGVEPDADGYLVQVDASSPQPIETAATIQIPDLSAGNHTVLLAGLAPNCTVAGDNPRTIDAPGGQTTVVNFGVTCTATTGSAQVRATTTGPSPDADGYGVAIDGEDHGTVAANEELAVDGLTPGEHSIGLGGIAANCQIEGDNPRTVVVTAGSSVSVDFTLACTPPPPTAGTLRIQSTTTGSDPDANGYAFNLDGGATQTIGVNATTSLTGVATGPHTVQLSGLAANCAVQGENPRTVTVGAAATTDVSFAISCNPTTGSIRVSVSTAGTPTDPDGYGVKLDTRSPRQIATRGSTTFRAPPGNHTVALTGVASNCHVADSPSRPVAVNVGATEEVSFAVTCTTATGNIRVSVTTSGSSPDPDGYAVELDIGGIRQAVTPNGTASFPTVAAGEHTVTLIGVALNCTVPEGAERNVAVTAQATAEVTYEVTCFGTEEAWTSIALPLGFSGLALWAASPTDLFVAGTNSGSSDVVIQHYDGVAWSEQFRSNAISSLAGFSGTSTADLVAVVGSQEVLRHQGGTWSNVGPQSEEAHYVSIWQAAGEMFAGGFTTTLSESGLLSQYDGNVWTLQSPGHGVGANGLVYDLSGSERASLYALGSDSPASEDPAQQYTDYRVLRFDGTSWSQSHTIRFPDPNSAIAYIPNGLWATGPNDVFVVGSGGRIDHYDGTGWSPMTTPITNDLADVWGASPSNVYAVGGGGTLHYDGTSWSVINTTSASRVWGTAERVFVLTQDAVLHAAQ